MITIVMWQNALSIPITSTKSMFIVKEKKKNQTNDLIVYIN
jgi:hypothetical protein